MCDNISYYYIFIMKICRNNINYTILIRFNLQSIIKEHVIRCTK